MSILNKAKRHCTVEEPCVWSHIDKVVPAKEYENTMGMMSREISTYFGRGHEDYYDLCLSLPEGVTPEELDRIPLLVYEPDAYVKQWRLFVVDPNNFVEKLPNDDRDLRVEIKGNGFESDLDSHLNLRLDSLRNIAKSMQKTPELFARFGYKIPIEESFVCDPKFKGNLKLVPGYKGAQEPVVVVLAGADHSSQVVVSYSATLSL